MKTKTIKQTGFTVSGTATILTWDNCKGTIDMEKYFLPLKKFTPKNMLRCVNDNGFGCQAIIEAEIDVSIKYDNGSEEIERTFYVDSPIHTKYFLGWQELIKQGIKC